MARLNISVPDVLYERLDRLRDRVNASKVCAAALEKELDMVEGPTLVAGAAETKVARLIDRLRGERERWFQRGLEAGETWAVETATLQELREFEENWSGVDHLDPFTAAPDDLESLHDELPESFTERDDTVWNEPLDEDAGLRGAYVLGWSKGVRDLWTAARPRLT